MRLTCFVLYFNCLVAVATSSEQSFCPASIHSVGAPITQVGLVLRSRHVKKRLQGQSQISCSLRCQQQDWCISVNYEVSRPEAGACELNTYGVETLDDANPNNSEFEKKKGWIYSQLRSAEFTQSLHACKDGSFTCSNGGTCEVDCKTFRPRCHCPAGFSGDKCENNDDECKSSPCNNGRTCVDGINRYSCTCAAGFTGTNCETDIDECAGNPCANGGTCKDGINGFTCECPVGYSGSTCEGCDLAAVGVQNRSLIPDESFSAPNYWQESGFPSDFFLPKNARLNGDRYWAAATTNVPLYLQVDLLSLYMICAVATQGGTISHYDTRATRYKLSLSKPGSSWQIYQEGGTDKEFQGNLDKPTVVKNALVNRPTAQYIRFIPTAWYYWPGFRVEVFGIRQ